MKPMKPRIIFSQVVFIPQEEGQGLVEYALILVLILVIVIAALFFVGPSVGDMYSNVVDGVATVTPLAEG